MPLALCPALLPLALFTEEGGWAGGLMAWILAALINYPIYYGVGLIVDNVRRKVAGSK